MKRYVIELYVLDTAVDVKYPVDSMSDAFDLIHAFEKIDEARLKDLEKS